MSRCVCLAQAEKSSKTAAQAQRLGCSKREAAQALKLAAGHAGKAAKRLRAAGFGDGARAGMEKSLEPEEAEQHSARRGTISAAEVQNWLGDDSGEEGAQSESSTDDDVDAALLAKMQATPHRKLAALSPSRPLRKSPESMGTTSIAIFRTLVRGFLYLHRFPC